MKRLTEAIVFSGRRPGAACASWPICRRWPSPGSARPRAAARGPARRAGTRPRRCARPRPANAWCPGRCRPRCAAGAGRATGRVRRSAAAPCQWIAAGAVMARGLEPAEHVVRGSGRRTSARAPASRPPPRRAARPAVAAAIACSSASCRATFAREVLRRFASPSASSSASRHAICCIRKSARHRGVVLGIDRRAAQFAQVGRALQRVLQPLVGLVDAHRPLHRHALRRCALLRRSGRDAPRACSARQRCVEHGRSSANALRQAEQPKSSSSSFMPVVE